LSKKYGWKVRQLAEQGQLPYPVRATPGRDVVNRAIEILKTWDARHFARRDEARAYQLAARLQLETAARSVSVTHRVTVSSLRGGNRIDLVAKGGKIMTFTLSHELHRTLAAYLTQNPGPLASQRGYQSAYRRAIQAAGGRVTGTHGARRLSAQELYAKEYHQAVSDGMSPSRAAEKAAGDAIQALGHSRHRRDHRAWYLGQ